MRQRKEKMMKQHKAMAKLLVCLPALALVCALAGCGGQGAGSESIGAGSESIGAGPESIGAGARPDTGLHTDAERPLYTITSIMLSEADGETATISPLLMNYSDEMTEGIWQGFLLDGEPVDWYISERTPLDTYDPEDGSFPLEPSTGRNIPIVLKADLGAHTEITAQAAILFADGREPVSLTATFPISELERPELTQPGEMIQIEAQELYNGNNLLITIPAQTIPLSAMPELYIESQYEYPLYYSFLNLRLDGELIQEGSQSTADGQIPNGGPADAPIPVEFRDAVAAGRKSGEVTFVLAVWETLIDPALAEPEVTIPYTILRQ